MIVLTIKKAPELNSGGYKKTGKQPACSAFEYPFVGGQIEGSRPERNSLTDRRDLGR